ncbi:MAG: hypothetical protein H6625_04955 [Bdellovibrionaceae bacterium]|nr:hypothetical protein [Pseudobdellovibrionaceae bacterium]
MINILFRKKIANRPFKRSSGQMVIEMILVMTVLVAIVGALRGTLQSSEAFKTLVQGPWRVLSGMMVAGNWNSPDVAINKHPALGQNHGSLEGTSP